MAAVLTCGDGACLSHESAAQLLGIRKPRGGLIHVSVPYPRSAHRKGITVHRRHLGPDEVTTHNRIPTTIPLIALVDLAPRLRSKDLERAIGDADIRGLIDPEQLREGVATMRGSPGVGILKRTLDRHTFVMTQTELEQRFLPIAMRAGLPTPQTQEWVNGFKVDFYWPELRLVVETDGLTYHRTAAQQSEDLRRDHEHAAAGLRTLRFSHAQIRYEPQHVENTLAAVK